MTYKSNLLSKIKHNKAKIGVIGLGYVGLPLACSFAKKKFQVIGFDIDKNKVKKINSNISYIKHISNLKIKNCSKNLKATNNFESINQVDVIILCLPTPVKKNLTPDLSYITSTLKNAKKYFKKGQVLILESSTYPGSTKQIILPYLRNFTVGKNFFLAYSPEREDPNNQKYQIKNIPKICSGYSKNCLTLSKKLYEKIIEKVVSVSNLEIAEFTKLYENIYRSVNIGLVNELKIISNKLNLNIYEIINAAKTKPFGFQEFYPGPGVGGHCIPVDPYYLSWVAKKNNIKTNLIYHAGKINSQMPSWIINKTLKENKIKKALILGVAYKKNVDDMRESPALDFIKILRKKKIKVDYHDPYIKFLKTRKIKRVMKSVNINTLDKYDIVYLVTDHDVFNYNLIKKKAKLIVDTRNVYKSKTKKILKL